MSIEERVKEQYPLVVITLVTVIIGAALADLMIEVRFHIRLWPLTSETVCTWGKVVGVGSLSIMIWMVTTHLAILLKRVPSFGDSIVAFLLPSTLLILNSFVGDPENWRYFYASATQSAFAGLTRFWNVRMVLAKSEAESVKRLLQPAGFLFPRFVAIVFVVAVGWLDQHGRLSQTIAAWPAPVDPVKNSSSRNS